MKKTIFMVVFYLVVLLHLLTIVVKLLILTDSTSLEKFVN